MTGLILDSNALLWWMGGDPRLSAEVVERIETHDDVGLSVVTPWELYIRQANGKLWLPPSFDQDLIDARLTSVPITLADSRLAAQLPSLHKDPFDRMILAQALNRGASVMTGDRVFADYGVRTILV